jgi:hypothetical protein
MTVRHTLVKRPPNVGDPFIDIHCAAGEAETALAAERHPFLFQAVRAEIRGVARLGSATAKHLVDDGRHVALLVPRMALLEGAPVIAEDLLEGVFVDSLPCGCQRAWLYHVLAPRSTRFCTLLRPPLPLISPWSDGQKKGFSKRKFLYAPVRILI